MEGIIDMKTKTMLVKIAFAVVAVTAVSGQDEFILSRTDVDRLSELETEFHDQYTIEKQLAIEWSNQTGNPLVIEMVGGEYIYLVGIRNGRPIYLGPNNVNAAKTTSTDKIQPGGISGLDLTGEGITVGIWDGGMARDSHEEFGDRVTNMDNLDFSDHATHVAGTMIALGNDTNAKGMATSALIKSWDWNSDTEEMAEISQSDPLYISNHSYGRISGWYGTNSYYWFGDISISQEDYKFGFYDETAQAFDQIAYAAPYYLIVKSAGNDRNNSGAHSGNFWHYHNVWNENYGGWDVTYVYDSHPEDGGTEYLMREARLRREAPPLVVRRKKCV